MKKFPVPPFNEETAKLKVQMAEDAWNTKNPVEVSKAYTPDSEWRNRTQFINGRQEIVDFLTEKWNNERHYKLKKELWGFRENRMAVRFEYEFQDKNVDLSMNFKIKTTNGSEPMEMSYGNLMKTVLCKSVLPA